jgi:hypothetical protein
MEFNVAEMTEHALAKFKDQLVSPKRYVVKYKHFILFYLFSADQQFYFDKLFLFLFKEHKHF